MQPRALEKRCQPTKPECPQRSRKSCGSVPGAVVADGLPRYARADIEIGGVTIHTAEAVLLFAAVPRCGQPQRAFVNPEQFDITRPHANSHLTFGQGARFCIGAALARIELTAVFERLFQRFPTMQLAVPIEALRWREHLLTGGFAELPVTW